jgi:dynein heavy chain
LERHLYTGEVSWPTFQYMVSEVQYGMLWNAASAARVTMQAGGKITDEMDRRMFNTYGQGWLNLHACSASFSFNPKQRIIRTASDFTYTIPVFDQISDYHNYIKSFPDVDSPEIFGLHPNADTTFRVKEVNEMFMTLSETRVCPCEHAYAKCAHANATAA